MTYWSMLTLWGEDTKGGNEVLNDELHGIRAGAWLPGEEKERGAEKKVRKL